MVKSHLLSIREVQCFVILFDSVCLSVCMSVCLSDNNFWQPWFMKFIFAHLVYLHAIRVMFVYEGYWVKVIVTGLKKIHYRYSPNGYLLVSDSAHVKFSIANNLVSITHTAVKCVQHMTFTCTLSNGPPAPPLDNIRVMVIVWRLRRNIIRTALCCLCDTVFTVSSTLMWAVLTGPADWVCHIGIFTPCTEAVA